MPTLVAGGNSVSSQVEHAGLHSNADPATITGDHSAVESLQTDSKKVLQWRWGVEMAATAVRSYQEDARLFTHRRPSINVGNPAIILHKSYRKPFGESDSEWALSIERYVQRLSERLTLLGSTDETRREFINTISYAKRHYAIHTNAGSVRVAVAVDVFDEFWTSKVIIDFSRVDDDGAPIFPRLSQLLSDLSSVEKLISVRLDRAFIRSNGGRLELRRPSSPDQTNSEVNDLCLSLSEEIHKIERDIYPGEEVDSNNPICDSESNLFADFIGFSLASPTEMEIEIDEASQEKLPLKELRTFGIPKKKFDNVFDNIRPDLTIPTDNVKLMRLVDALWPIAVRLNPYRIKSKAFRQKPETRPLSGEFAISRMNRGRALHVTSLGASSSSDEDLDYPLSYLILCPHRATWQIGRMIDRIHSLGVFRLASLFEHVAIDTANDTMRRLIDRLESGEEIRVIQTEFDRVKTSIDGGLHHRIEWSRYYLRVYESLLRGTTFQRVEGYQTYEEFVRRRIGTYFEAIDSTSRRFAYLSRLLMEKTNQSTNMTSKALLEFAEWVSVLPVSYYSRFVFSELNSYFVKMLGQAFPWRAEDAWVVFIVAYAAAVAMRNLPRRLKRRREVRSPNAVAAIQP